jgi:hypothetical protein
VKLFEDTNRKTPPTPEEEEKASEFFGVSMDIMNTMFVGDPEFSSRAELADSIECKEWQSRMASVLLCDFPRAEEAELQELVERFGGLCHSRVVPLKSSGSDNEDNEIIAAFPDPMSLYDFFDVLRQRTEANPDEIEQDDLGDGDSDEVSTSEPNSDQEHGAPADEAENLPRLDEVTGPVDNAAAATPSPTPAGQEVLRLYGKARALRHRVLEAQAKLTQFEQLLQQRRDAGEDDGGAMSMLERTRLDLSRRAAALAPAASEPSSDQEKAAPADVAENPPRVDEDTDPVDNAAAATPSPTPTRQEVSRMYRRVRALQRDADEGDAEAKAMLTQIEQLGAWGRGVLENSRRSAALAPGATSLW